MIRTAFFLTFLTTAAAAQELPALFNVEGVAADDVLNVRNRPTASSSVVGAFPYDEKSVEIVELDGNWGRVNVDGASGWVSMAYMSYIPGSEMPDALRLDCFGTEPFWSLEITQGNTAIFSTPEGSDKAYRIGNAATATARPHPHAILGTAPGENIAMVIDKKMCSDGMSDSLFGLGGTVVLSGFMTEVYSGCCSVHAD